MSDSLIVYSTIAPVAERTEPVLIVAVLETVLEIEAASVHESVSIAYMWIGEDGGGGLVPTVPPSGTNPYTTSGVDTRYFGFGNYRLGGIFLPGDDYGS